MNKHALILLCILFFKTYSFSQGSTDSATLIFYRSSLSGAAYSYNLKLDTTSIARMKTKSYKILKLMDGNYTFWGKVVSKGEIEIHVESGKYYFIKCGIGGPPFFIKPKFKLLSSAELKKQSVTGYLKEIIEKEKIKIE